MRKYCWTSYLRRMRSSLPRTLLLTALELAGVSTRRDVRFSSCKAGVAATLGMRDQEDLVAQGARRRARLEYPQFVSVLDSYPLDGHTRSTTTVHYVCLDAHRQFGLNAIGFSTLYKYLIFIDLNSQVLP